MDQKEYKHQHYVNNKDVYKERAVLNKREQRRKAAQFVWDFLLEHPCIDCGEKDPIVLEFDHIGDKYKTISKMISNSSSLNSIKKEMEKCEVRCANCHRRKTATQLGWYSKIIKS